MALLAFLDLRLPRQRALLQLLDSPQPAGHLITILLARLAQLMNLGLYFANRPAALLDLNQRAGQLFAQYRNIAAVAIKRLGDLLPVALEQALGLRAHGLNLAHLLDRPVIFIALIFDQPAQLIDLPLEIDNLRLLGDTQALFF